nr:hypothetical protein [uncultured Lacibacter sp.]
MASKQYISIVRLFEYCDIVTDEAFNLARAKKQLQAEFSIAKDGFIEVDSYSYTRHDVFEEIERPDFSERFSFHKQIWNNKPVLQLLEDNLMDLPLFESRMIAFTGNKAFDEFFSPYFAGPFSYLSRNYIAEARLADMGSLLSFEDFLQPAEREEAFRPLRIFLDENLRLLRNVQKENYGIMRPKILHWIETDWYTLLNNLPHEFYDAKNDIATFLINIGVAIQKSNKRDCRKMSEQLVSLTDMPEAIRSIIVSNHAAYAGTSSGGGGGWGNYFWIGWVIFAIIRVLASGSCNSNKQPDFNRIQIINDQNKWMMDSNYQKLIDSITGRHSDSVVARPQYRTVDTSIFNRK